uniref:Uncharacterized protein n=1 Tax=Leersia perrieri TaxID=77586 RepID=A0A0D9WQA1_9ORYZ
MLTFDRYKNHPLLSFFLVLPQPPPPPSPLISSPSPLLSLSQQWPEAATTACCSDNGLLQRRQWFAVLAPVAGRRAGFLPPRCSPRRPPSPLPPAVGAADLPAVAPPGPRAARSGGVCLGADGSSDDGGGPKSLSGSEVMAARGGGGVAAMVEAPAVSCAGFEHRGDVYLLSLGRRCRPADELERVIILSHCSEATLGDLERQTLSNCSAMKFFHELKHTISNRCSGV